MTHGGDVILTSGGPGGEIVIGIGNSLYFVRENVGAIVDHIAVNGRLVCSNMWASYPSSQGSTFISQILVEENENLCSECRDVWENYVNTREVIEV